MASLAVLAAVAEDGPVLIAVEDAHWVDHPTREVMMFVLLRLQPYDLRAIFARRPMTATERVTPGIGMLEVGPLDDEAAGQLLDLLHPGLPSSVRERVLDEAAGNPLAITELPQTSVGVELLPTGASLRTRLETGFAGRLLELAPRIRTTLLVAALDGDRLEHRAELSPYELQEAELAGLVTRDSTPSGLRFRHPLVRSAIIRTASPEETREAHTVLAEQHRADPELRMWHLAAATVEPDEKVAAEIEKAARAVSLRGGSGLAVKALLRAAELTPEPEARAGRLELAAELAGESGQLDLAQSLLDQARRHLDDPARALATKAQILMLRNGDLDAARRLLRGTPGAGTLVRVMAASYTQDPQEWAEVSGVVTGCDDDLVRLLHDVFLGQGSAALVRTALDALPADAPPGRVAALCRAATWMDVLPDYRDRIRDLIDGESGQGAVTHAASGYWLAAHDHFLAGQWEAAESAANSGLDLCVRHDLDLLAHDLRCSLGWLAAARGDADSAREYSRTVEQWAAPRGSGLHLSLSARNLALAAMAHGDYDSAYAYWTSISPPGVIPRTWRSRRGRSSTWWSRRCAPAGRTRPGRTPTRPRTWPSGRPACACTSWPPRHWWRRPRRGSRCSGRLSRCRGPNAGRSTTPGSGSPWASCNAAVCSRARRGPSCGGPPTCSPASAPRPGSSGPSRSCGPPAWRSRSGPAPRTA
ncbi:hypothetical protein ACFQ0B_40990 [Nonomuraea thailandensis]